MRLSEADEVFGARVREMFELGNSYFNEAVLILLTFLEHDLRGKTCYI